MIVRPGADVALERWKERRRRTFYPKTDDVGDIPAMRQRKAAIGISALPFLREKIPSLLEDEIRLIEFLPNAGTFHALFRIEASRKTWLLKASLENEAFAFLIESWASKLEIPAFRALPAELPFPFLIIEEAKGQPLNRFEDPETQKIQKPLLSEFGKQLASVHKIKTIGGGFVDPAAPTRGLLSSWRDYVFLNLESHVATCQQIGAINDEEAKEALRWIRNAPEEGGSFLHGDPGHHNVFSDGERITAIIDWEDALAGDPIFDIAYWGTFVRDEMRAEFLEGYSAVASLPADFEFRYWLYYLRIALSKTVHRHRFGTKDRPGRPPASLRIQKALSKLRAL